MGGEKTEIDEGRKDRELAEGWGATGAIGGKGQE